MFCCFDFFCDPLGLCFGKRFEFMLKEAHTGNAGATVADVVDNFVGGADDFAGCTMGIGVPGIVFRGRKHLEVQTPPTLPISSTNAASSMPRSSVKCA